MQDEVANLRPQAALCILSNSSPFQCAVITLEGHCAYVIILMEIAPVDSRNPYLLPLETTEYCANKGMLCFLEFTLGHGSTLFEVENNRL